MVNYSQNYYGSMDPQYSSAMASSVWRNYYFGAPTPATKALQLPEIAKLGMSGIQNVEIGVLDPTHWEAIPRQHFEQMKQLAKLQLGKQGAISVHAPVQPDAGGFSENHWTEENRQFAENLFKDVIDKAQIVQTDKNVPVPVTIHASNQPAVQWKWDSKANEGRGGLIEEAKFLIDPEKGEMTVARRETVQYPTGEKEYTTEQNRYRTNVNWWDAKERELRAIEAEMMRARKEQREYLVGAGMPATIGFDQMDQWMAQNDRLIPVQAKQFRQMFIDSFEDFGRSTNAIFDKAVKNLEYAQNMNPKYKEQLERFKKFQESGGGENPFATAVFLKQNISEDEKYPAPIFIPVENWAQRKGAETFAELGYYAYKKHGEKGPFVSVENYRPELAMGRGESLRDGLNLARELLAKKLMEKEKMSKPRAEKIAADKIKATWDIGHINLLKRFGMPAEVKGEKGKPEGFWKKEVKAIQDYIGHVHISDNFGYQDVHLAPGMGNTPIKEFLAHLEKTGKLGHIKSILESGGIPAHLGIAPSHTEALVELGVPLYQGVSTPGPTWQEIGKNYFFGSGGYSSGYGKFLPEGHFSEYGTGFSQLPTALGGARAGEQGKFSGTPMA